MDTILAWNDPRNALGFAAAALRETLAGYQVVGTLAIQIVRAAESCAAGEVVPLAPVEALALSAERAARSAKGRPESERALIAAVCGLAEALLNVTRADHNAATGLARLVPFAPRGDGLVEAAIRDDARGTVQAAHFATWNAIAAGLAAGEAELLQLAWQARDREDTGDSGALVIPISAAR